VLDDVHGGHGKTSSIDQAADVTPDVDVVEVESVGDSLFEVLLTVVLDGDNIFLTEGSVVIYCYLGVCCYYLLVFKES
jgi:hypothetical protein